MPTSVQGCNSAIPFSFLCSAAALNIGPNASFSNLSKERASVLSKKLRLYKAIPEKVNEVSLSPRVFLLSTVPLFIKNLPMDYVQGYQQATNRLVLYQPTQLIGYNPSNNKHRH